MYTRARMPFPPQRNTRTTYLFRNRKGGHGPGSEAGGFVGRCWSCRLQESHEECRETKLDHICSGCYVVRAGCEMCPQHYEQHKDKSLFDGKREVESWIRFPSTSSAIPIRGSLKRLSVVNIRLESRISDERNLTVSTHDVSQCPLEVWELGAQARSHRKGQQGGVSVRVGRSLPLRRVLFTRVLSPGRLFCLTCCGKLAVRNAAGFCHLSGPSSLGAEVVKRCASVLNPAKPLWTEVQVTHGGPPPASEKAVGKQSNASCVSKAKESGARRRTLIRRVPSLTAKKPSVTLLTYH